eukprot:13361443-Alexandrium_andersonii.AAC.1
MLVVCSLASVDRGQASCKQAPKAVQHVSCDIWRVARAELSTCSAHAVLAKAQLSVCPSDLATRENQIPKASATAVSETD